MTGQDAPYDVHEIPDFTLECGATLRPARVAYQTYGTLNDDRSNAIVYPTWYSGRHWDNEWLIGEGMALDPERWFIIVPNMLGNGLSSSPSNTPPPYDRARFPRISVRDNVESQYRLVTEVFGIETLPLVLGWSMGAGQTYQWAVSHPEMVQRMLPFCGSSRTSPHNRVFLEGVKAALTADAAFAGGWYPPDEPPVTGLRAAARVYAGWGFSQAFYWDEVWRELGYTSLEDFLIGFWEGFFLDGRDPNNLLTMLDTWWNGDVGRHTRVLLHRGGAGLDQGQGHRAAGGEGSLLPARGRGVGGRVHLLGRAAGHPRGVGTLRRRRTEPGGHRVHRCCGGRTARRALGYLTRPISPAPGGSM